VCQLRRYWGNAVNETVIYQDNLVTVTTTRAVLQGTTYAMANITSVRELVQPSSAGCLAAVAAVVGLLALAALRSDVAIGLLVLSLAAILGGVAWAGRHPIHWVSIGTAGAETRAISSPDKEWVRKVVEAINTAIIARG